MQHEGVSGYWVGSSLSLHVHTIDAASALCCSCYHMHHNLDDRPVVGRGCLSLARQSDY